MSPLANKQRIQCKTRHLEANKKSTRHEAEPRSKRIAYDVLSSSSPLSTLTKAFVASKGGFGGCAQRRERGRNEDEISFTNSCQCLELLGGNKVGFETPSEKALGSITPLGQIPNQFSRVSDLVALAIPDPNQGRIFFPLMNRTELINDLKTPLSPSKLVIQIYLM